MLLKLGLPVEANSICSGLLRIFDGHNRALILFTTGVVDKGGRTRYYNQSEMSNG